MGSNGSKGSKLKIGSNELTGKGSKGSKSSKSQQSDIYQDESSDLVQGLQTMPQSNAGMVEVGKSQKSDRCKDGSSSSSSKRCKGKGSGDEPTSEPSALPTTEPSSGPTASLAPTKTPSASPAPSQAPSILLYDLIDCDLCRNAWTYELMTDGQCTSAIDLADEGKITCDSVCPSNCSICGTCRSSILDCQD